MDIGMLSKVWSMRYGVSQCWPPSETCAVDWDAWAVGMALLGVLATIFLGFMTLRLGRAANRASLAAVGIAATESKAREKRDHEESLILMMRLAGEFSDAQTSLEEIRDLIATEQGRANFLCRQDTRDEVLAFWKVIKFQNYEACSERLHYLPIQVAARMARVVGIRGSFNTGLQDKAGLQEDEAASSCASFRFITRLLLADIEVIREACRVAVQQLGLDDADVVEEADRLVEGRLD